MRNLDEHLRIFDDNDDLQAPATGRAVFDVDIEYAFPQARATDAGAEAGVLLDVGYDADGGRDCASFVVQVSSGQHEFIATLPPTGDDVAQGPVRTGK